MNLKLVTKKYLKIVSVIALLVMLLFVIIIIHNKNKIVNENENIQKYKIKLKVNLVDNNENSKLIFSDNNISEVKVTSIDPFSPSIFIIYFNENKENYFENIIKENIGKKLVLYYNDLSISSIEINEEIDNNQLIFENIDDDILLDIVNNIFEYE
jgi:cell division protein FtsL